MSRAIMETTHMATTNDTTAFSSRSFTDAVLELRQARTDGFTHVRGEKSDGEIEDVINDLVYLLTTEVAS
jgi:hypothetical protein